MISGNKRKLTASSSTRTVSIMGIIMAVAAVLEIHIEMNIVTKNKPNVNLTIKDSELRREYSIWNINLSWKNMIQKSI